MQEPKSLEDAASAKVIDGFLRAAALDAETIVHRVRSAVLVLVFVRLVLFAGDEMVAGVFKHWLTSGILVLGLVASAWILRRMRTADPIEPWQAASALLDAALATLVILPSVLWPRETHLGLLRAPDVAFFPLVVAGAGLRLSVRSAMVGTLTSIVGLYGMVAYELRYSAADIRYGLPEALLIGVLLTGAGGMGYGLAWWVRHLVLRGAHEAVAVERVRQRFGAYVPAQFGALDAHPELGGERVEIAVLFSDLRGFTQYSEKLAPDALITELNAYFDAMVATIHDHGGVVDKFIGDAIMVVFGFPTSERAAQRAIETAIAMQRALVRHNLARATRGQPALAQGIGVHYGAVIAGNVGTDERLQFTVLGDTVNVAARLEAATKHADCSVLLSADVVEAARAEGFEPTELVARAPLVLRGRATPTEVYGLL